MILTATQQTDKLQELRDGLIGKHVKIETPFGQKPLVYADYTASGRSVAAIEDYIRDEVLPYYANTHSESSYCGAKTTELREHARQTIWRAVHGRESDKVIFCGSGTTAAVSKWIQLLDLSGQARMPVVFISSYEHHSNELPWRNLPVDLRVVPLTAEGVLDQDWLSNQLQRIEGDRLIVSSFSAASNVTGIKTDVVAINQLMKDFGAITAWDYAAAAPYVEMDMTVGGGLDAIFFSPHKFVGGPGTPGVLVANETALRPGIPTTQGGGTVSFVSPKQISWSKNLVSREEAGTPDIIGSIRAGLAMQLKQEIGTSLIEQQEERFIQQAIKRFSANPDIRILGPLDQDRLSILSFQVVRGDTELHFGLIVALLNDLYGIQARGGCSCAGRYGHLLLEIDDEASAEIDEAVQNGAMLRRPGWVRVNFNYFIEQSEVDYILDAIEKVADIGWELKKDYSVNPETGVWKFIGSRWKQLAI
ncbi:MAG: aminotransferase class V-fold PLP-dependent enzyme [Pseudomonadales bacterium]